MNHDMEDIELYQLWYLRMLPSPFKALARKKTLVWSLESRLGTVVGRVEKPNVFGCNDARDVPGH